jgi:integrase
LTSPNARSPSSETWCSSEKKFHVGAPKTEQSNRVVSLPTRAVAALKEHKKRMGDEGWDTTDGLVWMTGNGNALNRGNLVKKTLYPAMDEAGVKQVTWHQLRHTCATLLIEHEVPLEAVSRVLGHKDPSVTLKIYNKAYRAANRLSSDVLDEVFSEKKATNSATRPAKSRPSPKVKTTKKPR